MPAFVQKFEHFDLSINYDGITFYPKHNFNEPVKSQFNAAVADCRRYLTYQEHFTESCNTMESGVGSYRHIFFSDDDHAFYHHDTLDRNHTHVHCKFHTMLTAAQLNTILNTLTKNLLISDVEKTQFLREYNERIQRASLDLYKSLTQQQTTDLKTIIHYIAHCEDNDILVNIHKSLQEDQFNYLRTVPASSTTAWQGTDQSGKIVPTSETWALIEKNIAYQMAHNVRSLVSTFSPRVANERSEQLNRHAFFSIKRKQTATSTPNKMYTAFKNSVTNDFDQRYAHQLSGALMQPSPDMIIVIKEMKKLGYLDTDIKNVMKDINFKNRDGITTLFLAACNRHLNLVKALVNAGANVNSTSAQGVSPLFMMAEKGYSELVTYLVEQGADVNAMHSNYWTPILVAAENKRIDIVKYLYEHHARVDHNDARMRAIAAQVGDLMTKNSNLYVI